MPGVPQLCHCDTEFSGHVAVLVISHMYGLKPFEGKIERTTETITPNSSKTVTAVAMTTNRIASLPELLHYRNFQIAGVYRVFNLAMQVEL